VKRNDPLAVTTVGEREAIERDPAAERRGSCSAE
jgi:hypothetical protein